MKVLMINGSPHVKGNTRIALDEMVKIFELLFIMVLLIQH